MQKKVTLIIAILATLAGLVLIYLEYINGNEKIEGVVLFVIAGIAIISALAHLIGLAIIGKVWALRLTVVLSIGWLLFNIINTEPYDEFGSISAFIQQGIIPLVVIWGLIWVAKGLSTSKT